MKQKKNRNTHKHKCDVTWQVNRRPKSRLEKAYSRAECELISERELKFTFAICHRLSVCRLSVTLVHPTQAIEIFGNISTPCGTLAIDDLCIKILRRSSQENPSVGELNTRGVAEYSDFEPIERYISETVQ